MAQTDEKRVPYGVVFLYEKPMSRGKAVLGVKSDWHPPLKIQHGTTL